MKVIFPVFLMWDLIPFWGLSPKALTHFFSPVFLFTSITKRKQDDTNAKGFWIQNQIVFPKTPPNYMHIWTLFILNNNPYPPIVQHLLHQIQFFGKFFLLRVGHISYRGHTYIHTDPFTSDAVLD